MDESVVLFDLDSTLCTHPTSRAEALTAAFDRAGVEPFCSLAELAETVETLGETASMPYRTYRACERLAVENGRDPADGVAVAAALRVERPSDGVKLAAGATQLLDHLDGDHRLGLVTNGGPDTQDRKLAALGIADRFDEIVLAGFDTPSKPDPAPFERALDGLDATADEAVFVGNSLAHDVAGAHAAGLDAVWVRPSPSATADGHAPEHVVDDLRELCPPPWE